MSFHRRFALFVGFLAALYLLGCQEAPTAPNGGQVPGVQLGVVDVNDQEEVSGATKITMDFFGLAIVEKDHFEASKSNGEVEGWFRAKGVIQDTGEKYLAKGDVTCFTIEPDGKTARLGGLVTLDTYWGLESTYAIWTVIDNREEQANDDDVGERDFATYIWWGMEQWVADYHCDTGWPLEVFSGIEEAKGEIEVEADD